MIVTMNAKINDSAAVKLHILLINCTVYLPGLIISTHWLRCGVSSVAKEFAW